MEGLRFRVYIGVVLGLSWVYVGSILGLTWVYIGFSFGSYWGYTDTLKKMDTTTFFEVL